MSGAFTLQETQNPYQFLYAPSFFSELRSKRPHGQSGLPCVANSHGGGVHQDNAGAYAVSVRGGVGGRVGFRALDHVGAHGVHHHGRERGSGPSARVRARAHGVR